jgi:hypothetical protein
MTESAYVNIPLLFVTSMIPKCQYFLMSHILLCQRPMFNMSKLLISPSYLHVQVLHASPSYQNIQVIDPSPWKEIFMGVTDVMWGRLGVGTTELKAGHT